MKQEDELVNLFRRRLGQSTLEVREGFWESLQQDLQVVPPVQREYASLCLLRKYIAAASVLLVLGFASVVVWFFSPEVELQQAFTEVREKEPQLFLQQDGKESDSPFLATEKETGEVKDALFRSFLSEDSSQEECFTVNVSLSVRQRVYGERVRSSVGYQNTSSTSTAYAEQNESSSVTTSKVETGCVRSQRPPKWALKVATGVAFPKGNMHVPVLASFSVERIFNKHVSVEAGVQYTVMPMVESTSEVLSALAMPVKMNVVCATSKRWQCYASFGGAVEKTLGRSFRDDPLRLSVAAGMGIKYQCNKRLALFVEPTVSHHFDTDTSLECLRTEKPTNLNVLGGIRMTF